MVRSQSENLLHGPTKMWNWQSVAATVIGVFCENASSAGSTKWVSPANNGKYVTAAIRQPAMMIFSRPIRSESQPKKMKNGVPISSETPISV